MEKSEWPIVEKSEVEDFCARCLTAVGAKPEVASVQSQVIVAADYRGHYSHGLNRLEMYVNDLVVGVTDGKAEPEILNETPATAWVHGHQGVGMYIGEFCMNLAIKKAKAVGIGWVVVKDTTHYGICGWYSQMASAQGLVGMSYTNTSPIVAPTRSKQRVMGSNPITVAANGHGNDTFVLDMATSTVAVGKVEVAQTRGENIPPGWGCDASGKETVDPSDVLSGGALLPLGGMEENGGYKGYGLAMMVELFCGIFAGSNYAHKVPPAFAKSGLPYNKAQCFVAIDPNVFAPGFEDRMQDLMDSLRHLEPMEGEAEVLVPGDPERRHEAMCEEVGGIPYHPNQLALAENLAQKFNVEPMKTLKRPK